MIMDYLGDNGRNWWNWTKQLHCLVIFWSCRGSWRSKWSWIKLCNVVSYGFLMLLKIWTSYMSMDDMDDHGRHWRNWAKQPQFLMVFWSCCASVWSRWSWTNLTNLDWKGAFFYGFLRLCRSGRSGWSWTAFMKLGQKAAVVYGCLKCLSICSTIDDIDEVYPKSYIILWFSKATVF